MCVAMHFLVMSSCSHDVYSNIVVDYCSSLTYEHLVFTVNLLLAEDSVLLIF